MFRAGTIAPLVGDTLYIRLPTTDVLQEGNSCIFSVGKFRTTLQTAIFTAAALITSNITINVVSETGTKTNTNKFPIIEKTKGVRNGLLCCLFQTPLEGFHKATQ
jgi:hypothetical protein